MDQPIGSQAAIVTGAGSDSGIGFASARALLGLGVRQFVLASTTDRIQERVAELLHEAGDADVDGFVGDLSDPAVADALVARALERFGRLDICVNNAGMVSLAESATSGEWNPVEIDAVTDAAWQASLDRNLTTCFNLTRGALTPMRAHRYGRIVNVSSTSGPLQAFHGNPGYHAAKAGMIGLTRARVALEAARDSITVNAVAPGWVATGSLSPGEAASGALTPLGRPGRAHEIGAVVAFLSSPASSFVTGQMVVVDGGNSLPEDRAWRP